MSRKVKKSYHHGDLKAAMVVAALELVREKGPRGFTLNEASRRAGVSKSAPYNHFKDKEALLVEIILLGNRTLEMEITAAAQKADSDQNKLLAIYHAYIDFAQQHPALFAVMFQSGLNKGSHPEIQAAAERAFSVGLLVAERLEVTSEEGKELALAVWTMAHGFAMLASEDTIKRMVGSGIPGNAVDRLVVRLWSHQQ